MHYGMLFFLIVKLLIKFLENKNSDSSISSNVSTQGNINSVTYISNGKLLEQSHVYYYISMLNLENVEKINDEVIDDAAKKRSALINKMNTKIELVSSRDVIAAKLFLFDQWAYFTSYN